MAGKVGRPFGLPKVGGLKAAEGAPRNSLISLRCTKKQKEELAGLDRLFLVKTLLKVAAAVSAGQKSIVLQLGEEIDVQKN